MFHTLYWLYGRLVLSHSIRLDPYSSMMTMISASLHHHHHQEFFSLSTYRAALFYANANSSSSKDDGSINEQAEKERWYDHDEHQCRRHILLCRNCYCIEKWKVWRTVHLHRWKLEINTTTTIQDRTAIMCDDKTAEVGNYVVISNNNTVSKKLINHQLYIVYSILV